MRCLNCVRDNPKEVRFCASCGSAIAGMVAESVVPVCYAGFWICFAAYLADIPVVAFGTSPFSYLFTNPAEQEAMALTIGFLTWALYNRLFTGLMGQTLGKMLVRIKVVEGSGRKPGLGRAAHLS